MYFLNPFILAVNIFIICNISFTNSSSGSKSLFNIIILPFEYSLIKSSINSNPKRANLSLYIYIKIFEQTKNEHNKQKTEAKRKLLEEIENIKIKINLSQKYKIQKQEVLVGNKNLLELIKKEMNKPIENSMIFKLYDINKDKDENNYYFGEYINRYTQYSNTYAYLLLGLVLSNKRYRNFKNMIDYK